MFLDLKLHQRKSWDTQSCTLTHTTSDSQTDNISVYTRGDVPQPDTDVYINYTNQGYADVEPSNVTWEGVYSSLSWKEIETCSEKWTD